jgi:hypothetical protein
MRLGAVYGHATVNAEVKSLGFWIRFYFPVIWTRTVCAMWRLTSVVLASSRQDARLKMSVAQKISVARNLLIAEHEIF